MTQAFGHRKGQQRNKEYEETKQRNIQENDIVLNHNKITQRLLFGAIIIILAFVYILFQEKNSILYCDKGQNYCEIRREAYIGFRSSRDVFSPADIKDVKAKLNFTERFTYGPFELKNNGYRVYHTLYLINPQKNQIPIYTRYDNKYENSYVEKKLNIIGKKIEKELKDNKKDIIQFNLT